MTATIQSRQDIRRHLEVRMEQLITRKRAANADLSHRDEPLVADFGDAAVQMENDEALAVIVQTADQEIAAIERALERMESGLFGICESCGGKIPAARLAAVPHAVNCAGCAELSAR